MSQTTSVSFSPNKRARTFSQMSNYTNRTTNFMLSAPSAVARAGPKREVGGAGVQRGGTAGKNRTKLVIPKYWLERLMFPRLHIERFNYGLNMYGWSNAVGNITAEGDCKLIRGAPGKQAWFESIALPLWHPYTTTAPAIEIKPYAIYSLRQLMHRTRQAKLFETAMDQAQGFSAQPHNHINFLHNEDADEWWQGSSQGLPAQSEKDVLINKSFIYEGGYQRHTFLNHSNCQQWLEVYELHPRKATFDYHITDTDVYTFSSVGNMVVSDLVDNTIANGTVSSSYTQYVDEVHDPLVKITPKCKRTMEAYKCSKPLLICLAPGEQFVYTMDLPSFKFDNFAFAEFINVPLYVAGVVDGQSRVRPTSIPRFTKRLVVRAWAEIGHSDILNTSGTFAGSLQPVQVNILHLMEEKHNTRWCPSINKDFTEKEYLRTQNEDYALQILDDVNETIETVQI